MNNRIAILVVSGAAVFLLIAVLIVFYVADSVARADVPPPQNGSLLHPLVQREARPGYVIAELYQDVAMDVASGIYDQEGILQGRYWNHDAVTQTCSIDLVLADQHGRNEIAPTATPKPPDPTATSGPWVILPAVFDGTNLATPDVYQITPTPYAQTPTPYPTAAPMVVASTEWDHWKGRPVAIEADGLAVLDVLRDARVLSYLSVRTGADSGHNTHTELARMPLPDPPWAEGSAYVRLPDASGRILLQSDAVDAHYRAAALHLEISPLADCGSLRLRWQRPAAVVVKALTDQPFSDWGARAAPPPTPSSMPVLYAALRTTMTTPTQRFVGTDFLGGNHEDPSDDTTPLVPATTSTAPGHIVIPDAPCAITLQPGQACPNANRQDAYIGFAIRADLVPNGLSDIRQTGSAFNAIVDFDEPSASPITILSVDYRLYQSGNKWRAHLLGGEWSLRP